MADESQLFAEFAESHSEAAFEGIIQLHTKLVFATALRQLGDRGLAEEVTQSVFVALAQQQPGGPGRMLHPSGTFMLSAAGGQSSGVYQIDTRTGDTWYIVPGGTWSFVGNPTLSTGPKPVQPQK